MGLDEALREAIAQGAVIEQAKGTLMAMYGINAEQALGVLRWRAEETDTELRALASQLVAGIAALGGSPQQRGQFERVLGDPGRTARRGDTRTENDPD